MRFMIIRTTAKSTESAVQPNHELLAAMSQYYADVLSYADALTDESEAGSFRTRVKLSEDAGDAGQSDTAAKEIAALALIQVETLEHAIRWAREWRARDGDESAELEIREVLETAAVGTELEAEIPE